MIEEGVDLQHPSGRTPSTPTVLWPSEGGGRGGRASEQTSSESARHPIFTGPILVRTFQGNGGGIKNHGRSQEGSSALSM